MELLSRPQHRPSPAGVSHALRSPGDEEQPQSMISRDLVSWVQLYQHDSLAVAARPHSRPKPGGAKASTRMIDVCTLFHHKMLCTLMVKGICILLTRAHAWQLQFRPSALRIKLSRSSDAAWNQEGLTFLTLGLVQTEHMDSCITKRAKAARCARELPPRLARPGWAQHTSTKTRHSMRPYTDQHKPLTVNPAARPQLTTRPGRSQTCVFARLTNTRRTSVHMHINALHC